MGADLLGKGQAAVDTASAIRFGEHQFARDSGNWIIIDPDVTALSGVLEESHRWAALPSGVMALQTPVERWDPWSRGPFGARSIIGIANASIRFITVDRTPSPRVLNLIPPETQLIGIERLSYVHPGVAGVISLDDVLRLSDRGQEVALPAGFTVLTEPPRPTVITQASPLVRDFSSVAERLGMLAGTVTGLEGMSSDVAATIGRSLGVIESSLAELQSSAITVLASEVGAQISESLQQIEKSLSRLTSAASSIPPVRLPEAQPAQPHRVSNRAVQAVEDLQQWLDLTVDQVAELTGTSRSAIHYWKRENTLPRPGTARHLFKVHALVRALKAATTPDPPLSTLTALPIHGGRSAYDLLRSGEYDQAETIVRSLLFSRGRLASDQRTPDLEGDSILPPQTKGLGLKTPVTRARRVKLSRK